MGLDITLENRKGVALYESNFTHNAADMARSAKLYTTLWHQKGMKAHLVAKRISSGIALMLDDPARFKAVEPANGWGTYDQFLEWLIELRTACNTHPHSIFRSYG